MSNKIQVQELPRTLNSQNSIEFMAQNQDILEQFRSSTCKKNDQQEVRSQKIKVSQRQYIELNEAHQNLQALNKKIAYFEEFVAQIAAYFDNSNKNLKYIEIQFQDSNVKANVNKIIESFSKLSQIQKQIRDGRSLRQSVQSESIIVLINQFVKHRYSREQNQLSDFVNCSDRFKQNLTNFNQITQIFSNLIQQFQLKIFRFLKSKVDHIQLEEYQKIIKQNLYQNIMEISELKNNNQIMKLEKEKLIRQLARKETQIKNTLQSSKIETAGLRQRYKSLEQQILSFRTTNQYFKRWNQELQDLGILKDEEYNKIIQKNTQLEAKIINLNLKIEELNNQIQFLTQQNSELKRLNQQIQTQRSSQQTRYSLALATYKQQHFLSLNRLSQVFSKHNINQYNST